MFNIYRKLFLALKKVQMVKITPQNYSSKLLLLWFPPPNKKNLKNKNSPNKNSDSPHRPLPPTHTHTP